MYVGKNQGCKMARRFSTYLRLIHIYFPNIWVSNWLNVVDAIWYIPMDIWTPKKTGPHFIEKRNSRLYYPKIDEMIEKNKSRLRHFLVCLAWCAAGPEEDAVEASSQQAAVLNWTMAFFSALCRLAPPPPPIARLDRKDDDEDFSKTSIFFSRA